MMRVTGVKLNEIPYKGGAPAALAVASGDVQASWLAISTAQPMLRSGQLVALAVSTKDRVAQLPDVPTMAEQGFPAYDYSNWMGIMGPARMPPALLRRIESDLQKVVATPEFSEAVARMGSVARFESTEQFTRAIRESHARHKAMLAP
jgi:tripartite-type tricarboxylate transporter receptor subunit TctC